jgi:hypothetical protein
LLKELKISRLLQLVSTDMYNIIVHFEYKKQKEDAIKNKRIEKKTRNWPKRLKNVRKGLNCDKKCFLNHK